MLSAPYPELYQLWRAVNHLLAVRRQLAATERRRKRQLACAPLTIMLLMQRERPYWLDEADLLAEAEQRLQSCALAVLRDWPTRNDATAPSRPAPTQRVPYLPQLLSYPPA